MTEQTDLSPAQPTQSYPGTERRAAVRYSCSVVILHQTETAQPEDFWWRAIVRDISTKGISLLARRKFEPGTHLVLEPLTSQNEFPTLIVRVIRATKAAQGDWLLGCEFARQPAGGSGITPELVAMLH